MKYISVYNQRSGKWYPRSKNGATVSTETLCAEIADSTVSAADVHAVLRSLRDAMTRHLCAGEKVKLDNIGTFYLVADASKNGVATADEVSHHQINKVNVRFTPQKVSGLAGQANVPALAAGTIRWEHVTTPAAPNTNGTTPNPSGGNNNGGDLGE